jgi:hypothetical protein
MNFKFKLATLAILFGGLLTSASMAFAQGPQAPGGRGPLGFSEESHF